MSSLIIYRTLNDRGDLWCDGCGRSIDDDAVVFECGFEGSEFCLNCAVADGFERARGGAVLFEENQFAGVHLDTVPTAFYCSDRDDDDGWQRCRRCSGSLGGLFYRRGLEPYCAECSRVGAVEHLAGGGAVVLRPDAEDWAEVFTAALADGC